MASDTVVQYVLKVDAAGAQKALESTAKEATEASHSLDRIEHSSQGASKGMQQTSNAMQIGAKQARNFRRAGRDLDGALGDLAQGIGHLNPQIGSFIMEASDGVSIVEGLGRSLTLFTNPAVLAAGAVAVIAGGSFAFLGHEAEQARQQEEDLAKSLDEATKILEEQEKIIQNSAKALIGYSHEVDQARINLQLLTGQITQFEVDQKAATATAEEFGRKATESQEAQLAAVQASINARTEEISQLQTKIALMKQERAIPQSLTARIAGQPQQFEEQTFEETQSQKRLDTLRESQKEDRERLQIAEEQRIAISGQQQELERILRQTAEINEQERKRAAADKAREARKRKEASDQRDAEREQQRALKAQEQIQQILEKAQFAQLDAIGQINATYEQQAEKLFDLAEISGDIEGANAALVELGKIRNQQLDEEIAKQDELKQKELDREKSAAERAKKEAERAKKEAERAEKQRLKDKADRAQGIVGAVETAASLDLAGIAGLINPLAGAITGTVISLGSKTPEQIREEALAQAEAIKNGISVLPELILSIVPHLAIAITEAIIDGFLMIFVNFKNVIEDIFSFRDRSPDDNDESRRRRRRQAFRDFINPMESASFMGGGRFVPSAQGGIRFTGMQDGLAMLHRGEFVVPQSGQRPQQVDRQLNNTTGSGMTININSAVVDRNAVDALVREIEIRFNNQFGTSSSSLFGGR